MEVELPFRGDAEENSRSRISGIAKHRQLGCRTRPASARCFVLYRQVSSLVVSKSCHVDVVEIAFVEAHVIYFALQCFDHRIGEVDTLELSSAP